MEEELVMNTEPAAEAQPQEASPAEPQADADGSVSLESILGTTAEGTETEQPAEAEVEPQQEGQTDYSVRTKENKALRGRYQEDVQKGVQQQLSELRVQWQEEARQMIEDAVAPFKEAQIEQEAQRLVASRQVANIEMAREFARLKQQNGQPLGAAPQAQQTQAPAPRDERGRFVQQQKDPVAARAKELSEQAADIQRTYGIDVMAAFRENDVVRQNVGSGKWDFKDAAIYIQNNKTTKKSAPPAVRSTNGNRVAAHLTDRDMDAIDRAIANGQKVRLY